MRIVDLLNPAKILLGTSVQGKDGVIDLLVDLQDKSGCLRDREEYKTAILAREAQGSTAIEAGIAVPHAKSDSVMVPSLAACTLTQGVDYGAMDGQPSDLFFMIAAPMDGDLHLEILSHLMVLLMDFKFTSALRSAKTTQEFLDVIDRFETEKFGAPDPQPQQQESAAEQPVGPRILAVTACPTGIAHTYMAAEALEKKGAELGIPVKVETQGSGGAKNVLTRAEIAACDGIIIAADKEVDLSRFDGIKYGLRGEGKTFDQMIRDSRSRGFGDEVKRRILLGNYALSSGYYDAYYRKALALKQEFIQEYDRIFQTADIILTPTAPTVAYPIGQQDQDPVKMYTADICTVTVNIASLPAISTPCGYNKAGMPIGMSLIGRRFDEATLIQAADAFEQGFTVIPAKPEGGAAK